MYIFDGDELVPTHTGTPFVPLPTVTSVPYPPIDALGEIGHRTLWATFAIMLVSALASYIMAYRVPASKRVFHLTTALITTASFISYYAVAVGDGSTFRDDPLGDPANRPLPDPYGALRQVYWARYVNWAITAPLILFNLGLVAGSSGADILVSSSASVVAVLSWYFASVRSTFDAPRWGYYAIGSAAHLLVVWHIVIPGWRAAAAARQGDVRTKAFYGGLASFSATTLTVYPIVWILAEGTKILSVDQEIMAYAVLDVLTRPGVALWLLVANDALADTSLTIEGFWAYGLARDGVIQIGEDEGA